jgi:glycosyltransferase involved in cell wall biosynthesis
MCARGLSLYSRHGRLGPSGRLRLFQYEPWLREQFGPISIHALVDDANLRRLYAAHGYDRRLLARGYLRRLAELLSDSRAKWIEKELLPYLPAWFERLLLRGSGPVVFDYDDAAFHNYDLHRSRAVRLLLGGKIDRLMARADLVTVGNEYLADRARAAGSARVEIVPTVIDLDRYELVDDDARRHRPVVVGWIGSPGSQRYLAGIQAPLSRLIGRGVVRCRLVGATPAAAWEAGVESVPWTEDSEVQQIRTFDIGVMPLPDEPWARGKCAYKLIQYMACGIPVVASPVGANRDVVRHGVNGLLAQGEREWEDALAALAADPALRQKMGREGRARVEREYCVQVTAPRIVSLFRTLGA